ncbi:MAG: class I SAM-dependent methyltransferase [Thermoguttaceae bacterium]|jgi:23S rRNA (cytosine1962-C5)-methyltransferase
MFRTEEYQLLDFGGGRKLERFGKIVTDRPSPPAFRSLRRSAETWCAADLFFQADETGRSDTALGVRGTWISRSDEGNRFLELGGRVVHTTPDFVLELKGSPFGHLGIFPEQSRNWGRLYGLCRKGMVTLGRRMRVLNLFAYTGGSTLACASAGAEVTHVDAARNIVGQARRNAELSGLGEAPIRWIVDDTVKYVRRERRRKRFFDGVILDPPTYGHGARGEVWRLARDLPKLLEILFAILDPSFPFVLLTCHSSGFDAARLKTILGKCADGAFVDGVIDAGSMAITAATRARLPAGEFALLYSRTYEEFPGDHSLTPV